MGREHQVLPGPAPCGRFAWAQALARAPQASIRSAPSSTAKAQRSAAAGGVETWTARRRRSSIAARGTGSGRYARTDRQVSIVSRRSMDVPPRPAATVHTIGSGAWRRRRGPLHRWPEGRSAGDRPILRVADDGAVSRDQGRASRCAAVLPDGGFLRAVLRRRRGGGGGARHRADETRPASGAGHSHVRGAGACGRGVSADADPQGVPGRGLRADGGPGRGAAARGEGGGPARGGAAGHAGHADRGQPLGGPAGELAGGLRRDPRRGGHGLGRRLDGRTGGRPLPAAAAGADARPAGAARGAAARGAGAGAARAGGRGERGRDAAGAGELRLGPGGGAGGAGVRGRLDRGVRPLRPGGDRGAGRAGRLPGADAEGAAAAAAPAAAREPRRDDGDRRGHPAQPRTDPVAGRRARGRAARGDRPHPDRGGRPAARGAAGGRRPRTWR
jgi:hypothetical protein